MKKSTKTRIGWREWLSLSKLGIHAIKAKVDTGARTSALHAFKIEPFEEAGDLKVRFAIHPMQRRKDKVVHCSAKVIDQRMVSDSGGHREKRYVIKSFVQIGEIEKEIEITLTNRDTMTFRMLLGRSALKSDFTVDAACSYRLGKFKAGKIIKRKTKPSI